MWAVTRTTVARVDDGTEMKHSSLPLSDHRVRLNQGLRSRVGVYLAASTGVTLFYYRGALPGRRTDPCFVSCVETSQLEISQSSSPRLA